MTEKTNMSTHLSNPVTAFLETTSVKGVPQMMKPRSAIFRLLWGLSVLLGAITAGYFLVNLFMLYVSRKVTMAIQEGRGEEMVFPSLTLCNLNPLANTEINASEIMLKFEKFNNVLSRVELDIEKRYLFGQALDPSTLFVNFARDNGVKAWNFLVSCRWDSDMIESEESCVQSAQRYLYQTNYGYCFTFEPPDNNSFIYGFSVILYIDDTFRVPVPSFELNLGRPFASGALLAAHLQDSSPNIEQGVILESGKSTEVHITQTRRVQLEAPYQSNCSYSPSMPESQHVYTSEACQALCKQNEVILKCGCVDGLTLSVPSQLKKSIDFCRKVDTDDQNTRNSFKVFANRSKCVRTVLGNRTVLDMCDDVCPIECIEERYELTSAEIQWPHPTTQLAFYVRYVKGKPYQHRFNTYKNLAKSLHHSSDFDELYDTLSAIPMITDNFLQVNDKQCYSRLASHNDWGIYIQYIQHELSTIFALLCFVGGGGGAVGVVQNLQLVKEVHHVDFGESCTFCVVVKTSWNTWVNIWHGYSICL